MAEQENTSNIDQSKGSLGEVPLPDVKQQLQKKLSGIAYASFLPDCTDLFNPANVNPPTEPTYPPGLASRAIAIDDAGSVVRLLVRSGKFEQATLDERTRQMFQLAVNFPPFPQEVQQTITNPETARALYTQPEIIQGMRLTDFLLDNDVIKVWIGADNTTFTRFVEMIRDHQLPACLTSDAEMQRLEDAFQGNFGATVRQGIQLQEDHTDVMNFIPSEHIPQLSSARSSFLELCRTPKGELKQNLDLTTVIAALNSQYPNG